MKTGLNFYTSYSDSGLPIGVIFTSQKGKEEFASVAEGIRIAEDLYKAGFIDSQEMTQLSTWIPTLNVSKSYESRKKLEAMFVEDNEILSAEYLS